MKWRRRPRSGDLIDRRGARPSGGGLGGLPIARMGLPGLLILGLMIFLGGNLFDGGGGSVLEDLGSAQGDPGADPLPPEADPDARLVDFVDYVQADVQDFWQDTFEQSDKRYERAELVLFEAATQSGCGGATEQIGPHYCPPDQRIYIDLDFFRDLRDQYGAPGDFAQAYVIAHEVAHHVQNLLGLNERVQNAGSSERNEMSIRLELQADCLSGVWAFTVFQRDDLEEGDLEEGLGAAAAVGDDRLQKEATGRVDKETWTHGSSEQRMRWFQTGFEDGDPNACDTFAADAL
ncbi:MAG: neutral zinc metallopeptidase [Actinomycetota bacterium]